jgi:hypothetical protein
MALRDRLRNVSMTWQLQQSIESWRYHSYSPLYRWQTHRVRWCHQVEADNTLLLPLKQQYLYIKWWPRPAANRAHPRWAAVCYISKQSCQTTRQCTCSCIDVDEIQLIVKCVSDSWFTAAHLVEQEDTTGVASPHRKSILKATVVSLRPSPCNRILS